MPEHPPHDADQLGPLALRRAGEADIRALADLRTAMQVELRLARGDEAQPDEIETLRLACRQTFTQLIATDHVRAWVAVANDAVVGTAMLVLTPALPSLGTAAARDGRVRDVYVLPGHRRRGVARALMHELLCEAQALDIGRLTLGASSLGRPLYESLGFIARSHEMIYCGQTH